MQKYRQLDTDVFDKYFGGFDRARSVGIFIKMGNLFLASFNENVSKVKSNLQQKEFKQAQIVAHRLKGALRTVGGTRLGDIYYNIEMRCAEHAPISEILRMIDESEYSATIFAEELKAWMNQLHSSLNGTYSESPSIKGSGSAREASAEERHHS